MLNHEVIEEMYRVRNKYNRTFKASTYMDAAEGFCAKYMDFFQDMNDQIESAELKYEREKNNGIGVTGGEQEKPEKISWDKEKEEPEKAVPAPVKEKIGELADEFVYIMAELVRHKGKRVTSDDDENVSYKIDKPEGKDPSPRDMLDINMFLVMFVFPCIIETKRKYCKELAEAMVAGWNGAFHKNKVDYSDFATINSGFRRKFCYITTAVCDEMGYDDDCEELMLLRRFRDAYMMFIDGGKEMIDRYYEEAPAIVESINTRTDSSEIYRMLYRRYINPCVNMIREGELEECLEHYKSMVCELGADIRC